MDVQNWDEFKFGILGTCLSIESAVEMYDLKGVDRDSIEELLEIESVQCCPECGWWVESYELEENGDDVPCESCRFN